MSCGKNSEINLKNPKESEIVLENHSSHVLVLLGELKILNASLSNSQCHLEIQTKLLTVLGECLSKVEYNIRDAK